MRVSPFDNFPQLVERKAGLIDMMIPHQPGVQRYRFYAAKTIKDAYGNPATSGVVGSGPVELFVVDAGRQFRSPSVIKRRFGWYGEQLRGMTRVAFDPYDYYTDPAKALPSDEEVWFIRIQEYRTSIGWLVNLGAVDTGDAKLGSIYVVPPADFFTQPQPGITLYGISPANTTSVAGSPPAFDPDHQAPNPLHLVFPRRTSSCYVNNLDGNDTLLASPGWGQTMTSIPGAEDPIEFIAGGGVKGLVLAGAGANSPNFSVYATIALGPSY